jgi:rSAM/selenodomain-associated transferase 2
MLSVVIPTWREALTIANTVRSTRESALGPVEIVVSDAGADDTVERALAAGADRAVVADTAGRAPQMNWGAREASGDLLLFLHADTVLPQGWDSHVLAAFADEPAPVATAFSISFDEMSWKFRLITWAAHLRMEWTGVPHGDQAIAIRRGVFDGVGGWPLVPLMEEYEMYPLLVGEGEVRLLDQRIVTSGRRYRKNGPLRNALRNSVFVILHRMGVSAERLARGYT